jgi:uncharacterized protein YndB with AHSA1/START domain
MRHAITVQLPPDGAFARFTEGMSGWWPREYTWAQEALEAIAIEPMVGGRCYERGPHGFSCDWGRVVECEPPALLVFTWQISPQRVPQPDPERASEVEVRFTAAGTGATRVELEHRDFERHGTGAESYRSAMTSEHGWPLLLERYAALGDGPGDPGPGRDP